MIGIRKSLPTDLETPVGWWRCTRSKGENAPLNPFRVGELYPCVQNGPSAYPQGTQIPKHRRSYRLFSDQTKMSRSERSVYWDGPSQTFWRTGIHAEFEFVRRFTYAEQQDFLAKGCSPHAFDSVKIRMPELSLGDVVANWLGRRKAPKPAEAGSAPEAALRYFFEYKSTAEGKRAVVSKRTAEWGVVEVGFFKYGVDAQEYVDFKNVELRRQHRRA